MRMCSTLQVREASNTLRSQAATLDGNPNPHVLTHRHTSRNRYGHPAHECLILSDWTFLSGNVLHHEGQHEKCQKCNGDETCFPLDSSLCWLVPSRCELDRRSNNTHHDDLLYVLTPIAFLMQSPTFLAFSHLYDPSGGAGGRTFILEVKSAIQFRWFGGRRYEGTFGRSINTFKRTPSVLRNGF